MKRWFKHKVHGFGKVQSSNGRYALVLFRGTVEPIPVLWDELQDLPAPLVAPYGLSEPAPSDGSEGRRRRHPRPRVIEEIDWNGEEIQSPYALSSNLWKNIVQVSTNGTTIRHKTIPLEPHWGGDPELVGLTYLNKRHDVRKGFDEAGDFDHDTLNAREGDRRTAFEIGYRPPALGVGDEIEGVAQRTARSTSGAGGLSEESRAQMLAALDKRRLDMLTVLKVRMENDLPWDRISGALGWSQSYVRGLFHDIRGLLGPEMFKRKAPAVRTARGRFAPPDYDDSHETLVEAVRRLVRWERKKKYPWRYKAGPATPDSGSDSGNQDQRDW
jgi:hypothetical protein